MIGFMLRRAGHNRLASARVLCHVRTGSWNSTKLAHDQLSGKKASSSDVPIKGSEYTTGWSWFNIRQYDHLKAQRAVDNPDIARRRAVHFFTFLATWAAPFGAFLVLIIIAFMLPLFKFR